jgi:hypothetical protein
MAKGDGFLLVKEGELGFEGAGSISKTMVEDND